MPQITSVINSTKNNALLSSAKLIAKSAETEYETRKLLGNDSEIKCSDVAKTNSNDYSYCNIIMRDGTAYVSIKGIGKFLGTGVYGATKNSGTITSDIELANNNVRLATKVIIDKAVDGNTDGLIYDDFGNVRYSGADKSTNPTNYVKNYVTFNGEAWRIIGVFDVYTPSSNKIEKRIKLIRNASLGNYSWDTTDTDVNSGLGYNIWETINGQAKSGAATSFGDTSTKADVNALLNDCYYGGTCTTCYDGRYEETELAKATCPNPMQTNTDLIESARWNLGGSPYDPPVVSPYHLSLLGIYEKERGSLTGYGHSTVAKTTWDGIVALMYPSDYGYASTNNNCRKDLRSGLYLNSNNTINTSNADCKNSNWLFNSAHQLTLSPYSPISYYVFSVYNAGFVNNDDAFYGLGVRPTVYLKSNVLITSGTGESNDPYILGAGA